MKGSGSPTTPFVPVRHRSTLGVVLLSVERTVIALVFCQALAPLAKPIGFYGDTVVDAVAIDACFVRILVSGGNLRTFKAVWAVT